MQIMKNLAAEGKSILFISHKLNEIVSVAKPLLRPAQGQITHRHRGHRQHHSGGAVPG